MHPDPAPRAGTIDPAVLDAAADWLLRLREHTDAGTDPARTQEACRQWVAADPEHARAWQRAERLLGLVRQVPSGLAVPMLGRPRCTARRTALRRIGSWLLLAPAGWLTWQLWDDAHWDASERSAPGRPRTVRLADGGTLELDGATAVDIAYGTSERLLRLRSGQILVQTAADTMYPARPLRVATEHGRMQALGTRFNVRVTERGTQMAVLEGAVLIEPGGRRGDARRIDAGQQAWFDLTGVRAPHPLDPGVSDWLHGMLVADNLPLGELIGRLAEQNGGMLRCDPAVAHLPISGAWPLHDPDRSLAMLEATLPVRVRRHAGGLWTRVEAAPSRQR